ncbi:MAG: DUF4286 family protein [Deltaproteobacteria bacterium]|nr:DUF4286 family protein [Deltaproteobacteria bacterium]
MGHVIYNVALILEPSVEHEWREWMLAVHIPEVLRVPGFLDATMYRQEVVGVPAARPQYVNSYRVQSREALQAYCDGAEAKRLRAEHEARFGDRVTALRTVWSVVQTYCGIDK